MEEQHPKSPVLEEANQGDDHLKLSLHVPKTGNLPDFSTEPKPEISEEKPDETKEPTDWFEPLEDDDEDESRHGFSAIQRTADSRDPDEESLAGESDRSESVAGSEKGVRRKKRGPRRRQCRNDEGWEDCPTLGEGWKRKETVRQSGTRSGQSDIYYMSPSGARARSRIELSIILNRDLSSFEFKSGVFSKNGVQRLTLKRRKRRKHESIASELVPDQTSDSSFVERGDGADSPDSHHRLTPTVSSKPVVPSLPPATTDSPTTPRIRIEIKKETPPLRDSKPDQTGDKIKLPGPTSSKPLSFPSINGEYGPDESVLVCSRCGLTFTGTWYDRQRKKPRCPSCWAHKTKEHPLIRFRKWIPCGQCAGCHNKVDCGLCSNCKGRLPGSRKRICRKRKCLCPIRKGPGGFITPKPNKAPVEEPFKPEITHYQHLSIPSGDNEDFTTPLECDEDDDDGSTDDGDDDPDKGQRSRRGQKSHVRDSVTQTGETMARDCLWHKRRKRRACGECPACLRKDCGTCDFCVDKPKFGGSNRKRQKCRQRQCQRQAMRHLLPSQFGGDADDATLWGRAKPQYTYSRKRKRAPSEDEDEDSSQVNSSSKPSFKQTLRKPQISMQLNNSVHGPQNGVSVKDHNNRSSSLDSSSHAKNAQKPVEEDDEEDFPSITQIYSLADEPSDANVDHDLKTLLDSLRSSTLPVLWYAVMVDGPQLQLLQCSKRSPMADTIVHVDPNFNFQVSVQRQPLLPTHPLYDAHPPRLDSMSLIVNLLLEMDKYVVCHGVPPTPDVLSTSPIILERAATCLFLIKKNETICTNCKILCE